MSSLRRSLTGFFLAGIICASPALRAASPIFEPVPAQSTAEGETLSLPITASDPDNDPIRLSMRSSIAWMSFDGSVFTAKPGEGTAGSYNVTFVASDRQSKTKMNVEVIVMSPNRPPVLENIGEHTVGPGEVLNLYLPASDPDGDSISFNLLNAPAWVQLDGSRLVAQPGSSNLGQFEFTVVVSDGQFTDQAPVTIIVQTGADGFPSPWTAYIGSHSTPATWSGWVRGAASIGLSALKAPGVARIEEYITGGRDAMLQNSGFSGDRLANLFDLIESDNAATWQRLLAEQFDDIFSVDSTGQMALIQNGNEITKDNVSIAMREWALAQGISIPGTAKTRDPEVIPYYVEYYFAPTVEAIRNASAYHFGDPHRIPVVLGSIGNIVNDEAKDWLDQLLSYRVEGIFAPSLAGRAVYEMVDIITVHYPHGNENLAEVWDRWGGIGRIRGLWTTEDIGIRVVDGGSGAATALRALGRHLSLYYKRHMWPDEGRVSFYGWNEDGGVIGTSPDEALSLFHTFFGDVPLEVLDGAEVNVFGQGVEPESYFYRSLDGMARAAITVTTDIAGSLDEISIGNLGWAGSVTAELHIFSPNGHSVERVVVTESSDRYTITPSKPVICNVPRCSLLITLEGM